MIMYYRCIIHTSFMTFCFLVVSMKTVVSSPQIDLEIDVWRHNYYGKTFQKNPTRAMGNYADNICARIDNELLSKSLMFSSNATTNMISTWPYMAAGCSAVRWIVMRYLSYFYRRGHGVIINAKGVVNHSAPCLWHACWWMLHNLRGTVDAHSPASVHLQGRAAVVLPAGCQLL